MTVPLVILAIGAVGVGIVFGNPLTHGLQSFLGLLPESEHGHAINVPVMIAGSVVALIGIAAAWGIYGRGTMPAVRSSGSVCAFPQSLLHRRDLRILHHQTGDGSGDHVPAVRSICRGWAGGPVGSGAAVRAMLCRPLQNGLVQFYALLMVLGTAGFLLAVLLR